MLLGALAVAAPASADEAADRDARARFEEGLARVRASDFEGARVSFAQALAVLHKPDILWNLALSEAKTQHPLDALQHFKEYLHEAPPADPDRERARKHIIELSAVTGHIEVVAPPGASVTVDATRALGFAPLVDTIDVMPGRHSVAARLGAESKTVGIETAAGQTARADLSALAASVPPPGATAPQSSSGGGTEPQALPPDASTAPAPDRGAAATSSSWPTAKLVTVGAAGGTAVVLGAVALGFGIASSNDASRASALRAQNPSCVGSSSTGCQQLVSTTNAQHDDHLVSTGMWVAAGVLAAGAVGTYFLWPRTTHASISAAPAVGPGSAGIVAVGHF